LQLQKRQTEQLFDTTLLNHAITSSKRAKSLLWQMLHKKSQCSQLTAKPCRMEQEEACKVATINPASEVA
jgi:hypothetical protein